MIDGELYKRGFSQPFLKCLTPEEGNYVLREIHEGMCGNHLGGKALAGKSLRQGFFWPKMLQDAHELVRRCRACQEHANVNHQPAALMQPLESPCPFDQWRPKLAKISEKEVIKFLWKNIICRFGIPRALISDNGTQFSGNKLKEWCKGLSIKQFFTSRREHGDELPSVLWAYRTTPRTATGESPFNLSYGTEAVAPAEIGELSWRVKHYDPNSNAQGMRMNLDLVEEAREKAAVRGAMYKARMAKAYNAKVKPRNFQVGTS
ncbi:UNVERIFIED_CONTAM: hypothetical protein Sradi_1509700 [Sesamum radiatum]|uniref:Integrase zinc-binding domain-containing protein n=1 Tax=Sesamum radiatum TaxID=300843 RepID=A0AAW2U777_SESRA